MSKGAETMKHETYISILMAALLFPSAFWLITLVDYTAQINTTIIITIVALPIIIFSAYKIFKK
jgi:hypothetical protein